MKVTELNSAPKVPFDLDGKILFSQENIEIVHLTLQPAEEIDIHKNPVDVLFWVLNGTATLTIETEEHVFGVGNLIEVGCEENRGWKNTGDEKFEILVIKLVKPNRNKK
ncbi:MAG: cupin domain-containing protein [Saprospiraceae bacterium]|nr:cupin domain-containing protein [Saprospiraceae bacterium]